MTGQIPSARPSPADDRDPCSRPPALDGAAHGATDAAPADPHRRGAGAPRIDPPTTDWHAEARRAAALVALGNVWDPELGLDVVSLGLVYDVRVAGDDIEIDMTLTTPGCPVSEQLPAEAEATVHAAVADAEVTVRVVWDPPWTPERLTPVALQQLGFAPRR